MPGRAIPHPCEFGVSEIDVFRSFLDDWSPSRVVDPFAGRGLKLGALCDELGIEFVGFDIEKYPDADPRVEHCDARLVRFDADDVVVTSPVFLNRMSTDYVEGPKATTVLDRRRTYGTSVGQPLQAGNLARSARPGDESHLAASAEIVGRWPDRCIVHVNDAGGTDIVWRRLLRGYEVDEVEWVQRSRHAEHHQFVFAGRLRL